jgi:Ca2+:H+ antiporter
VTRGVAVAAVTLVLTAVGGVLHYAGAADVATFVVTGLALGGVAWQIGIGTESIATHLGPAATGVVQSTLGNLPGFRDGR